MIALGRGFGLPTRVLAIVGVPLIAVQLIASEMPARLRYQPGVHLALSGILFAVFSAFGLLVLRCIEPPTFRQLLAQSSRQVCGWCLFGLLVGMAGHRALILTSVGFGIFVAASAEEVVFRVFVPNGLASILNANGKSRAAYLIAVVASQVMFSASHFLVARVGVLPGPIEMLRLFLSGLLYTVLVVRAGVWFASAVHASLNVDQFYVARSDDLTMWVVIVGAIVLPLLAITIANRTRFAVPQVHSSTLLIRGVD